MKRIRVARLAERDLDDVWLHIAQESGSIETANKVVESITEAFSLLARAPKAGSRRDAIEPGLRGFPAANYLIYYREREEHIMISRVIHGMRDQKAAFSAR